MTIGEIGADDYFLKPFHPHELVARIRAILRLIYPEAPEKLSVGDIELDTGTRIVFRMGERIDLTAVDFNLLEIFLRSAGHVVSREQLAHHALARSLSSYNRSIDTHVSNLRKKLGPHADGTERIKSIRLSSTNNSSDIPCSTTSNNTSKYTQGILPYIRHPLHPET